jgi:hypothetical protein
MVMVGLFLVREEMRVLMLGRWMVRVGFALVVKRV